MAQFLKRGIKTVLYLVLAAAAFILSLFTGTNSRHLGAHLSASTPIAHADAPTGGCGGDGGGGGDGGCWTGESCTCSGDASSDGCGGEGEGG